MFLFLMLFISASLIAMEEHRLTMDNARFQHAVKECDTATVRYFVNKIKFGDTDELLSRIDIDQAITKNNRHLAFNNKNYSCFSRWALPIKCGVELIGFAVFLGTAEFYKSSDIQYARGFVNPAFISLGLFVTDLILIVSTMSRSREIDYDLQDLKVLKSRKTDETPIPEL